VLQFVGDQPLAPSRGDVIAAAAEDDVVADRIGVGADGLCRAGGVRVSMNPDVTEILAESRLEQRTSVRLERLTTRAQQRMHTRRRQLVGPLEQLADPAVAEGALHVIQLGRCELPQPGRRQRLHDRFRRPLRDRRRPRGGWPGSPGSPDIVDSPGGRGSHRSPST
jgi:hypothetical protein